MFTTAPRTVTPSEASSFELREAARGEGPVAEACRRELARRAEREEAFAALLRSCRATS